jgi:O-antigen/teichoic acid export membrane protein
VWTPFLWSLLGDSASKLAVLATTLIAVRALDPARFATYVGLLATAIVAGSVWDAGVSYLITREFSAGRISIDRGLLQALSIRLRLAPVWAIAFAVGTFAVSREHSPPFVPALAFGLASAATAMSALTLGFLRGALSFKAASLALASGRWATLAVSLLTFTQGESADRLDILSAAIAVGEIVTVLASGVALIGRQTPAVRSVEHHLRLQDALPFGANVLLGTAYNRFDVVILAALTTFRQLSFYAPASRIQDALYLLPSSVASISLPLLTRAWESGGPLAVNRLMRRLAGIGLLLAMPAAVIVTIYAAPLISLVLGPQYLGATTPTRILVWFLPLAALEAPILAALAATGHAGQTTKVFAAAFVTAIVAHCSLDWWAGATGGAVASLVRDPVALVVAVILARQAGLLAFFPRPVERG